MKIYNFNTWNRGYSFIQSLAKDKRPVDEYFVDYVTAVEKDLQVLIDSAFPHFFMQPMKDGKAIKVTLDKTNLGVSAKVISYNEYYDIKISLGLILSIDDASATLQSKLAPNEEVLWSRSDEFTNIEPRFYDYSFILDIETPGGNENFIYAYSTIFASADMIEMVAMTANFAILWLILHEIGHIQLDHIKESGNTGLGVSFDDIVTTKDHDEDYLSLRLCQEFAADTYASNKLYSTFLREDAIKHIFPKIVNNHINAILFLLLSSIITPLLLHRSQSSSLSGGDESIGCYPEANVRLFNTLAIVTPAADNNQKFIAPILRAFGQDFYPCDIKLEDLIVPYIAIIWVADVFLQFISSTPLFPWIINPELVFIEDGIQARNKYGKVNNQLTIDAETEIIAAALLSCRAYAEFKSSKHLQKMYDQWISIIKNANSTWNNEIDKNNFSAVEFAKKWATVPNYDPHTFTTLGYIHEVSQSAKNINLQKEKNTYLYVLSRIEAVRELRRNM